MTTADGSLFSQAIVIALSVGLVLLTASPSSPITDEDSNDSSSAITLDDLLQEDTTASSSAAFTRLFTILIPALYAAPVGHYLSACLRFDYHQSRTSLDSTNDQVAMDLDLDLETVPALKAGKMSTGIIVPSHLSLSAILPRSKRSYYNLTMGTTTFVYAILVPTLVQIVKFHMTLPFSPSSPASASLIEAVEGIDNIEEIVTIVAQEEDTATIMMSKSMEEQLITILAMFIAIPLLSIAVGIMARMRGESRQIWTYREEWFKKPSFSSNASSSSSSTTASLSASTGSAVDGNKEDVQAALLMLPAYSDEAGSYPVEKKRDVELPAYEESLDGTTMTMTEEKKDDDLISLEEAVRARPT